MKLIYILLFTSIYITQKKNITDVVFTDKENPLE